MSDEPVGSARAELLVAPERPIAHFVGRKAELEELAAALASGQSVAVAALQGMGGIGKTALALQLANDLKERFPGGMGCGRCWASIPTCTASSADGQEPLAEMWRM